MPTVYRLVPEGKTVDLELAPLRASFPTSICLDLREGDLYATIESAVPEDRATQLLINRELDRIYFLTCVRLRAEMCCRTVTLDLSASYRIQGRIPAGTKPQQWTERLSLQLKLWALAMESADALIKILLLFQIIELSYPDTKDTKVYPRYVDPAHPPHPRTEAKLLRHLVAHAGDAMRQTGNYLKFLGLPPRLSNLTHPEWSHKVSDRVKVVEGEARDVVQSAV